MNGWSVFAHPLFLDQLEKLVKAVEGERGSRTAKGADASDEPSANQKLLASIASLAFDEIPNDPGSRDFRQGNTLGSDYKNWSRAKFGGGRFRLFFRYRSDVQIIVYAWVNDRDSLRTRGSRSDAYATFRRMLEGGNPPDDWEALLAAARSSASTQRMKATVQRLPQRETRAGRAD